MKHRKYVLIILLFFLFLLANKAKAVTIVKGIENFPEEYKPYLYELKRKYPNWEFIALYTGLDFDTVINNEYANDSNLVPISYSDNWKCTIPGIYNTQIDLGWVNASKSAIEYVIDTRNFLNEVRIFQFEKQTYDDRVNTKDGIERILYGTEFYQRNVEYYNSAGNKIVMDEKYSDLIWNAAIYSGVSPYNLASRIKQEVGPFITHNSISGRVEGFEGLFNFFNIGATSSTENMGAIKNGLRYALNANNASNEVKENYLIPWNTPARAITGGAVFIGSSYISKGQYTLYLQKFDVNSEKKSLLYNHQYMTNCLAPYNECSSIYKAYQTSGMLNSSLAFVIPVYENMPAEISKRPDILSSDYTSDNTKVYAEVSTVLNVRAGPNTSYEVLKTVTKDEIMTRIQKGIQNGERWDKVRLNDGIEGYVFQSYIREYQEIIEKPEENYLYFDESLKIEGDNISGLDLEKLSVSDIKSLISTNLKIEIYNINNKLLENSENIGTGSKLVLKDNEENVIYEFIFVIYGDANGDGLINSLDLLIIQKHILEIKTISNKYLLKAADVSKKGKEPTSLDLLKIQKHILEIKILDQ